MLRLWLLGVVLCVGCAANEPPDALPTGAPEIRQGLLLWDPARPVMIEFEVVEDEWVVDGDILLHPGMVTPVDELADSAEQAIAAVTRDYRWPNGLVPYVIDADLPDKQRVRDAIAHWESKTHVRFVKRDGQADYVYFTKGPGCAAQLGRTGGRQWVKVAAFCGTGELVHEIGHAVGLWHEQSRADRGEHVEIRWKNIEAGRAYNFQTYIQQGAGGVDLGPYNYSSIMHYGSYSFSKNGKPTIVKKGGGIITPNRDVLSDKDIAGISKLYPPP